MLAFAVSVMLLTLGRWTDTSRSEPAMPWVSVAFAVPVRIVPLFRSSASAATVTESLPESSPSTSA
ncbi:MAG: hypothetical protein OXU74_12620 [Gemmatimonadota bacterium]|nr:hypothetical protein [Gemmatimonadota bacterium]